MTEAGSVLLYDAPGEAGSKRPGIGRQAGCSGRDLCVDDDGSGRPVPGRTMVVKYRSDIPGSPPRVYGDPEPSARTWVDGWLVTGRLADRRDGYTDHVGRSKDVSSAGGTTSTHRTSNTPSAASAAAGGGGVGLPNPVLGEDRVAVVASGPVSGTGDELCASTPRAPASYKDPPVGRDIRRRSQKKATAGGQHSCSSSSRERPGSAIR